MKFFLIVHRPLIQFTGRVSLTPSNPYMGIDFYNGAGSGIVGETVYFSDTPSGTEKGMCRLRTEPTIVTGTAGYFTVGENYDVGPFLEAADYITVTQDFRLWPIHPRITGATGFLEDYDHPYVDQNQEWPPIAVAGPPGVGYMANATGTVQFVGAYSYAVADGATIASYLWRAYGSIEGTSSNAGTVGSPVTFTWNAQGQYLVSLTVTDSNGKTHTAYTYAFVFDPTALPDWVFTEFDGVTETGDWDRGGWEADFTVRASVSETMFAPGALVVHASYSDPTTPTITWPGRQKLLFCGRIIEDSIYSEPKGNSVSFRASTIDGQMRNTYPFPGRLQDNASPTMWTQGYKLTVDRALAFLATQRSTLANMTPLLLTGFTERLFGEDFDTVSLYDQMNDGLMAAVWGRMVSSCQGVLRCERNVNLMLTGTERNAVTVRKNIANTVWQNRLTISAIENESTRLGYVDGGGNCYSGTASGVVMLAEAPGPAPKFRGSTDRQDGKVIASQTELNARLGHYLAMQDSQYPKVSTQFINDGSFDLVPQEWFAFYVGASENNRGLNWAAKKCVPRTIRRNYRHDHGTMFQDIDFEPETVGNPGRTVEAPVLTGTVQPSPAPCQPGWHWDAGRGECVQDELPTGSGKRVIMGAQSDGTARIVQTLDITASPPVWFAIDNGGFAGQDWLENGIKLDPFHDRSGAFAATVDRIYYCSDFNAVTPVWTEILYIQDVITAYSGTIIDYTLSIEEEGLIVVAAKEMAHGIGGINQKPYMLHSHNRGGTWYSTAYDMTGILSNPEWISQHGVALDTRPDSGIPKPHIYNGCQGTETGGDGKIFQWYHNADHTLTQFTGTVIPFTGARAHPMTPLIPYTPIGASNFYWFRYLSGLENDSSDTKIAYKYVASSAAAGDAFGPAGPDPTSAGGATGRFFNVATWDRDLMVCIYDDKCYASIDRGLNWTEQSTTPVIAGIKAGSAFPYNENLVYFARESAGALLDDPADYTYLVAYSPDLGVNWQDKSGNLVSLLGLVLVSNDQFIGRGIVPTWTGD